MNKKFLSAILFGTLMVTSAGTFVSCRITMTTSITCRDKLMLTKQASKN